MARLKEIFNRLVEEKILVIRTVDKATHESLRIRLVKLFARHKAVLEDIGADDGTGELSVCAYFDVDSGTSTFRIQERKTKQSSQDFEIVEMPKGTVLQ